MSVDLIGIHSRSSMRIMPSVEVSEQSSIAGPVGPELPITRVLPTVVSSLSLSEKLDYWEITMLTGMMCILFLIPANILI